MEAVRRLGVFVFYDKNGLVGDYVFTLLDDIISELTDIVIVCNGEIVSEDRRRLAKYTKLFYQRQNEGFDVTAWKDALFKYIGWDKLAEYDELLLFNNTFYGPFYPFSEVFTQMETRDIDFWGLTVNYETYEESNKFGTHYIPTHLQSYFLVIRKPMLISQAFRKFWEDIPRINCVEDAIANMEIKFTQHFSNLGFRWASFTETSDLETDVLHNVNLYIFSPYELIKYRRMPVLKRNFIMQRAVNVLYGGTDQARRVIDYLKKETNYDVGLILRDLLRTKNIRDIFEVLGLQYIIPACYTIGEPLKRRPKVALILYVSNLKYFDRFLQYVNSLSDYGDLYLVSEPENEIALREKFTDLTFGRSVFIAATDRGQELSALLISCKEIINNYDYICLAHDTKLTSTKRIPIGMENCTAIFENLLASRKYVENILRTFESEPLLGILAAPFSFVGEKNLQQLSNEWVNEINYLNTLGLLDRLGIKNIIPISPEKAPVMTGTAVWFRPKALTPLLNIQWSDFDFSPNSVPQDGTIYHAVERALAFIAQSQGFYTGTVMNDAYAPNEITNLFCAYRNKLGISQIPMHSGPIINSAESAIQDQGLLSKNVMKPAQSSYRRIREFLKKHKDLHTGLSIMKYLVKNKIFGRHNNNENLTVAIEAYDIIASSPLSDKKWYKKSYCIPESRDAVEHYFNEGWKLGYNPSPNFSTVQYLIMNADVKKAKINPLYHFEKYGRQEGRNLFKEPFETGVTIEQVEKCKKVQDVMISKQYSKNTKKLIVYLVPTVDSIGGGVMSICSLARVTKELPEVKDYAVMVATLPSCTTFNRFTMFEAGFDIFRFDQLRDYFTELEEIIIHIPEAFVLLFLLKLQPEDGAWLHRIKKTKINIMNQNIELMLRPRDIEMIKLFADEVTMTCAHRQYCSRQLRTSYDMSVHLFSASNLVKYDFVPYKEKKDLLLYSPDSNPFKGQVLETIRKAFPKLEMREIRNLSYKEYLKAIAEAKWVITFGEGIDGYFMESARSGAIPFSVWNYLFFNDSFDGLENIYESYNMMLMKIVDDMKRLDNERNYTELNRKLRDVDRREYDDEIYKENIRQYYLGNYTWPIEPIYELRRERLKKKPLVSIVLATYNGEKYLGKQLESLADLNYPNLEIIASDDGSQDNTMQILEEYSMKFLQKKIPFTILKNKSAHGLVGNYSYALKHTKGEYVALCDQDDIWESSKIETLLSRIDDFDIVQGQLIVIDEKGNWHPAQYMHDVYETNKTTLYNFYNYLLENPMLGCATLMRTDFVRKALPVPKGFIYHDWWLVLWAIKRGRGICNIDDQVIYYRQHTENTAKTTFESNEWCDKKVMANKIILKSFSGELNSSERMMLQCDINKNRLYNFSRRFAPKLAYEYFENNSLAFNNDTVRYLQSELEKDIGAIYEV